MSLELTYLYKAVAERGVARGSHVPLILGLKRRNDRRKKSRQGKLNTPRRSLSPKSGCATVKGLVSPSEWVFIFQFKEFYHLLMWLHYMMLWISKIAVQYDYSLHSRQCPTFHSNLVAFYCGHNVCHCTSCSTLWLNWPFWTNIWTLYSNIWLPWSKWVHVSMSGDINLCCYHCFMRSLPFCWFYIKPVILNK